MNQNADNEIVIDVNKELKILGESKKAIFACFLIFMSIGFLLYYFLPKKYTSEAKLLIKNTGSTNLSYINPFVVAETSEDNGYNKLFSAKNPLNEEIEIIKSPLVLDNVILENNLKYKTGPANGKYLSAKDFLRKNFSISKLKDADIIYISYKSKDPVLSYNVVNSIINSYKKIQKDVNTKKAYEDTKFLEKAYKNAERKLNYKISLIKKYKQQPQSLMDGSSLSNLGLLGFYDKRFKKKLKQISDNETDLKKLNLEIEQNTEELNSLKEKFEWSSMVQDISKNVTDMVILQSPEIKELYDYSEPQPIVIFILSLFGWILSCSMVVIFRKSR